MKKQVTVSERALLQRVNRKLTTGGEVMKKSRPRQWGDFGDYYIVDTNRNFIIHMWCDLEEIARDVKAMAEWETLAAA